jgi:division protein CdvB (Snf7/Vps24/ESCRT-III family)
MSVIKGLGASLGGIMPEANAYLEDLSKMLGDVIHSSAVGPANAFNINDNTSVDTLTILEEAHRIIEGQTKASLPELPTDLKEERLAIKKEALI